MTDTEIQQAIKLKELRDRAFSLANKVSNYGIFMLEREDLRVILNEVSQADMDTIKGILTRTMNDAGNVYADTLKRL